jgi:hypothetical protein
MGRGFPDPEWDGDVLKANNLSESLSITVSSNVFKMFASASRIEAQTGTVELVFSEANLKSMRTLAEKIASTSPKPKEASARHGR